MKRQNDKEARKLEEKAMRRREEDPIASKNDITIDDIISDPNKFGMPTWEQYKKNPEKFKNPLGKKMDLLDGGSTFLKNVVDKYEYVFRGWTCKTLEQLETIMREEGTNLDDCEICPEMVPSFKTGKVNFQILIKERLIWTPNSAKKPVRLFLKGLEKSLK